MSDFRFLLLMLIPLACASAAQRSGIEAIGNIHRCTPRIISGGEPETEEAFRQLAETGVKTIVSVDGVAPNVELARKHGLRYVHIPFGYGGVPKNATLMLTRVARECNGTIFVHCHHGKHRGPAAAAIVGLADGDFTKAQATEFLQRAGTSEDYRGLWESVDQFAQPSAGAKLPDLVEAAPVKELSRRMVTIQRRFRSIAESKESWEDRLQNAILLREDFRELARDDSDIEPSLKKLMATVENNTKPLIAALRRRDTNTVRHRLGDVGQQCVNCHAAYRQ